MRRDPVTSEVRAAVFARDKRCILSRLDDLHVCRDKWGQPHMATATGLLTVEHVHDGYGMMGRRAPSDLAHLVAMCSAGNVGVPSKAERAAIREYLERVK